MHLFELSDEQREKVVALFQKMQEELVSDYLYKHDSLRTQVMDLIHFAMKMQPSLENEIPQNNNASHRIVALFSELLECQFPIENGETTILRAPSDYAKQLNIHTNHLNRAVKEIMGRTTSEIINERLIQEAKILLRYTSLNIAEIAYLLGFNEAAYFTNFFKKQTNQTPINFRKE